MYECNESTKKSSPAASAAAWLVNEILNGPGVLFHDERRQAYFAVQISNGLKTIRLGTEAFKQWLFGYYWNAKQEPLPRDTDSRVAHTLAAYAVHNGQQRSLGVRLNKGHDGLWYDLRNGAAVQIKADGWHVTTPPPIFRQFEHQQPQVEPRAGGHIDHLRNYLNVSQEDDEDWLLFMVNLVAAYIPGFPHPILILYGPQGAGKSTPLRLMKKLIDPSALGIASLPHSIPEFAQVADHHAFLTFDNLTSLSTKMSDALARASTGDGFNKRKLYSDDDDVIYYIQRPIAMNGINQVVVKPDLLDRSILIKLERIEPSQRILEDDFWQAFEHDRAEILGSIFDVLAKALKLYPTIELQEAPRMADFTTWGCAIAIAAGYTQEQFLSAYRHNIKRQNDEAIEASPVAKAVLAFMDTRDEWTGTATQLLIELNRIAFNLNLDQSNYWPNDPARLGRRLGEVDATLNAIGIHLKHSVVENTRLITFTKDADSNAANAVNS